MLSVPGKYISIKVYGSQWGPRFYFFLVEYLKGFDFFLRKDKIVWDFLK